MITPFEDLLSQTKGKVEPLYFFYDESYFFSDVLIERIKRHYVIKGAPEGVFLYHGDEFPLESFIENVRTVSLFSSKKLFICKEADRLSKDAQEEVLSVIKDPSFGNCFIFITHQKSSSVLFKFCKKALFPLYYQYGYCLLLFSLNAFAPDVLWGGGISLLPA